jgi:hypothetical protein
MNLWRVVTHAALVQASEDSNGSSWVDRWFYEEGILKGYLLRTETQPRPRITGRNIHCPDGLEEPTRTAAVNKVFAKNRLADILS